MLGSSREDKDGLRDVRTQREGCNISAHTHTHTHKLRQATLIYANVTYSRQYRPCYNMQCTTCSSMCLCSPLLYKYMYTGALSGGAKEPLPPSCPPTSCGLAQNHIHYETCPSLLNQIPKILITTTVFPVPATGAASTTTLCRDGAHTQTQAERFTRCKQHQPCYW